MDRLKIPSGTVQRLEDIFDRMQEFIKDNILRRFVTITANEGLELFSSHGPVTDQLYGVIQSSTELKVLLVNGLNFSIQPGTAMLENGELIRVSSVINAETSADADTYYLVSLVYDEAGSVPITAQVAFVYDKTVASPYSTKNTEFTDSYVVTLTEIGDSGAVLPAANELPLAIIQTNDTGLALLATNWTRLGVTAANGVIDLRATYSLKLNHDLLDDSTVLFKDRASTGDNKVDQNIEFSQTTTLSGPVAMTGGGTNTSIPGISNSIFMLGQGVLGPGGAGLQVATLADLLDPLTFQEAAATRGTILVVRTGGELYEDTLVGTSGTPEFTIRVSDPPTGGQPLTVSGLSVIDNGSTETWCEVTAVSGHNETYNYWEFTADWRDGVQDITYDSGTAVAEYGVSGDGGIKITANASPPEGTAPFIDIFTIDNEPWNGLTIEGRFGNYKGFLGESSIRYGIAIGDTDSYLTYNKIDGLKIKSDFEFIGAASFSGTILIGTGAATEQIHLAGTGTDTTTQLYTGAGVYGGSSTGVYIDASGRFSLGETLKWTGSVLTMTEWDAAYTHSETAGGNSVHVSTDENTAWDEAKAHSIVTSGNPHAISGADLTLSSSDISDVDATSYKRFIRPGEGWYSAEVYHTTLSSSMKFGSGVTHQWDVTTQVPIDVTAVAAIKLHYYSQSTGNLWLKFQSYLWDTDTLGSYVTTDETDASSAYAGEGIGNALGVVIVPSGAYDGLGSLNEGDIFGFHVTRFGGDENDTFEQDWNVIGIEIIFS